MSFMSRRTPAAPSLRVMDPERMFSSTVRCLNTRRPSGTMTAP